MSHFQIVVGTVYGSTIELAEECKDFFSALGHTASVSLDPELSTLDLSEPLLVLTASTGMGDIPDSLMPLYCDLLDESPDLSSLTFALVGLGDSNYAYFNGAALRLNERLLALGAHPLVDKLLVDASEDVEPAESVMKWLARWVD